MDKYRPCPSIIAMVTSDSQHPPRSRHAVYLGDSKAVVLLYLTFCLLLLPLWESVIVLCFVVLQSS